MTNISTLKLSQLSYGHDPEAGDIINARVTRRDEDLESLTPLIRTYGIIIPLIVVSRPNGYFTVNGNRRLKIARDVLGWDESTDIPVRVIDAPDGHALEASLATAISQKPLHPVDEFEAFDRVTRNAAGIESNLAAAIKKVAADFGREPIDIERALAVGALSPKIRAAWRAGDIDEDTAKAFTLCQDFADGDVAVGHKEQDALYAKLAKAANGKVQAYAVRAIVRKEKNDSVTLARLRFIGEGVYTENGGRLTRDLFDRQHIVHSPALCRDLAQQKLHSLCQDFEGKGWAWAIAPEPDSHEWRGWRRYEPEAKPTAKEAKRLKEIEALLDGRPDDLTEDTERKLFAEQALIEESYIDRAFTPDLRSKSGVVLEIFPDGVRVTRGVMKPRPPEKANETKQIGAGTRTGTAAKAQTGGTEPPVKRPELSEALRRRLVQQQDEATRDAIREAAAAHKGNRLLAQLANVAAALITPDSHFTIPHALEKAMPSIRDVIPPPVMNAALQRRFDAADYFASIPKDALAKAIAEIGGGKVGIGKTVKKDAAAKWAVAGARKTGWLPKLLRTSHYDGPPKASKGKKR